MALEEGGPLNMGTTVKWPGLPDLGDRNREPELMDAPDLDPSRHIEALEALARVNRVSGVARRVWTFRRARSR